MPAECEVDSCGVLAVGRCHACKQAFCATHQARRPGRVFVDWCAPCMVAAERREEGSELASVRVLSSARERFKELGIPTQKVSWVEARFSRRWWGSIVEERIITREEDGWMLGQVAWNLDVPDGRHGTYNPQTVLASTVWLDLPSHEAMNPYPVVRVEDNPRGLVAENEPYEPELGRGVSNDSLVEKVAALLSSLDEGGPPD